MNPFAAVLSEHFGVDIEPEADAADGPAPITGMSDVAGALLASIGLAAPDQREGIEEVVRRCAGEVGLELDSVSRRYSQLTLTAESTVCALLRLELDRLQAALDERFPGQVTGIRLKVGTVRRRGRTGGGRG